MAEALSFTGVGFAYPGAEDPALRGATFSLPEGAFALVAGPTGAGKSTLLRCCNGLVPHFTGGRFEGRVRVGGRDTLEHRPRTLAATVGFVPQDPGASFVLDRVEDELAYAMENLGVPRGAMRRRVEEVLDLMRIEPLRGRSVRQLSGGERQRVAIAAALTAGPRVLVLDEPTSQLDPQGAEDVLAALARLVHELGTTVLMAEHRLERVVGTVDLALGCRPGEPPRLGPTAEVLAWLGAGPPVARLGRLLGWRPVPLTVREARRAAGSLGRLPGPPPRPARLPAPGEPLLRAEGLRADHGRGPVLQGVDLELRRGEVVALMGRNGAGKTTLLRCLVGLHPPAAGRVVAAGGRPPEPGRDAALCPQVPEHLLYRSRAVEEVAVTLRARGRDGAEALALLEELGIGSLAPRHPREVSAGQRLLIAVAAVVATGAPALLLDEPTRGLDPEAKGRLSELLRRFTAGGGGAVVATHDVELAAALATRVVLLAGGEVIADGPPAEVLADSPVFSPEMTRVFGPGWLTPEQVARALGA